MTDRNLEEWSKEELLRELRKLQAAERRTVADIDARDPERLLHELHVHHVELEMQNRELLEAQGRLEESRARYADLYDFAPVGYCTLDPTGGILEVNLTGAALLGASRDALVGRPFASVARLRDKRAFRAHMKRCTEEETRVTSEVTLSAGGRGGRELQLLSDPVRGERDRVTAYRTILIDISELKELERQLRLLAVAGEELAASLEYGSTLETAARLAVPALADLCVVDVLAENGTVLRPVVVFADMRKQETLAERLKTVSPRSGWLSPQARVIESREPMLLSEVSDEQRGRMAYDDKDAETLRAIDIRSLMVVPLVARGRALGTLTLAASESDRRYASSDLRLAQGLASRAALALDNAALYAEAQRANHQLRLAEAKSSGILSISADAIISIDKGQHITLWNDGAEKIFGYSRAEAVGSPLDILFPERLRAIHRRHVERFAAGEAIARRMGDRGATIVGLRKNGEEFPVDAAISKLDAGGETILTVALRDITDQKRIEKEQTFLADVGLALATTLDYDETLSRIVELAVRDLADFCIVDIVEDDGGVRRHKVVSRDPAQKGISDALLRLPPDRSPSLTAAALETKRPVLMDRVTPEMIAASALGEEHLRVLRAIHPRSAIAVPLLAHGRLLGALALLSTTPSRVYGQPDIALAEELGRRAALSVENAGLYRAAQRAIQARDDVLGVVAHDLRNPLGSILMQAQMLVRRGREPERRSLRPAELIERSATRMNRLIEDLLDVTRVERGRLAIDQARVPAARLISDAKDAQKALAASAGLELRIDAVPDLPEVWADRDRVFQVLENLIGNAVKFTGRGGGITLGAEAKDDEVLFWVKDTGAGISPEDVPHVFDRFWQAQKKGRTGAGLGLPIAKAIVEAHGGRIWFESERGSGATVFFTLRRADARAPRLVLLADDDADSRALLGATLEHAGYTVVTFANGAEALSYLHRAPAPFVIIVDLVMPVMDGWAFLAEKNGDPGLRSIPAIVVSGQRDVGDKVAAAHASYVPKPVPLDRLLATVESIVH